MPASLTSATVSPASARATSSGMRARSLCSCRLTSRAARMPWRSSRIRVWRVSSQASTSASPKTRSTRSVTSSRLPIGVGHTRVASPVARLQAPAQRAQGARHRRAFGQYRERRWRTRPTPSRNTPATARGASCCALPWRCGRERVGRAGAGQQRRLAGRRSGRPLASSRRPAAPQRPPPPGHRSRREALLVAAHHPQARRARRCSRLIVGWLLLSLVLFLVSSHFERTAPPANAAERARTGWPPAHLRQQHPRAGLRQTPEGQQGTGRRPQRAEPLGHDHADPHRRRARRAPLDPARHGDRNPRPRPAEDQRRLRLRRARRVDLGDQELPRGPDQPPRGGQLRKLPCADRSDGRRHLHRWLRRLQPRRRLRQRRLHAAPLRRHPPSRRQGSARACAHPREPLRPTRRPTSTARNTSRRCWRTCSPSCSPPPASCACR